MYTSVSQPIPIASSSKDSLAAPRNPVSPYFLQGSPLAFRQNSYGQRLYPGCSPAQPLGPLDMPDFNFKSVLSSSIESEHDSLIKALNGDVMSMQDDMCRNYTCCGLALLDLHALVEHFEEAHVVVFESSGHGASDMNSAGFDMDDMEIEPTPASAGGPFQNGAFPTFSATSAFDTTSVLVRRGGLPTHNSFSPYPTPPHATPRGRPSHANGAPSGLKRYNSDFSSSFSGMAPLPSPYNMPNHSACVPPALLFSASATPSPLHTPAASRGTSPDRVHSPSSDSLSCPSTPTTPSAQRPQNPLSGLNKPFRCPKEGCNKSYKQANGLKYHITQGQCNFAPRDPTVEGLSDQEAEKKLKPFLCQVGCSKRFKNMSGLRYHYQHTGEHGRIGLALLQSGQIPVLG